jgi:hypothetical protein
MMNFQTIKTKDGKTSYHGTVVAWHTHDEFLFVPVGMSIMNPWWCKLDYWDLFQGGVQVGKINVAS